MSKYGDILAIMCPLIVQLYHFIIHITCLEEVL